MKENKSRQSLLQNGAVQSLAASLLCILLGLLAGYVVLLIINPAGAWGAITPARRRRSTSAVRWSRPRPC